MGVADIVNPQGFCKATDTSDLDVDNAASSGFKSKGRAAHTDNGFVQANRGSQLLLQSRVVIDLVIP